MNKIFVAQFSPSTKACVPKILRVQVDNGVAESPGEVTVMTAVTTNLDDMFTIKQNPYY